MSTQSEREAAARAWWAHPCHDTAARLLSVCETGYGFRCPPGHGGQLAGTVPGCLSLWAAWCSADAASAAPTQPEALTLEQARAMCRKAGDTVVTGGYEDAPRALACLIAGEGLGEVDGHLVDKALRDEALCRSEIARLRALGVTPAVLS